MSTSVVPADSDKRAGKLEVILKNRQQLPSRLGLRIPYFPIQKLRGLFAVYANPTKIALKHPSRTDCLACHTEAAGFTLGLNTPQLNRDFDYSGTVDNQLRSWNNIAMFTNDIGSAISYSSYPALSDSAVSIEQRARTYLDVNCAQCHQPAGTTPVDIDLRLSVSNAQMNAIGQSPQAGDWYRRCRNHQSRHKGTKHPMATHAATRH